MATTGLLILSPAGYPGAGLPLDLSQYMDVNPGDGLDVANPEFSQRTFSHALLREGGVQALENLVMKELTFPLKLRSGSRDQVSALLQQVNVSIQQPGQTVLWQDQGSSQPTYFDIAGAQFDVEYDFRLAGNSYLKGKLRLFVQPLGHTATMRLVASAAGSGPLLTLPMPSPVLGDAPALMQAQITGGSFASAAWDNAALSVLPFGYTPEYQASQLTPGASTTLVGGSGAVASLFLRQAVAVASIAGGSILGASSVLTTLNLYADTQYRGQNRLFALARATSANVLGLGLLTYAAIQAKYLLGGTQALTGPTAVYVASLANVPQGWSLLDLGVIGIASSLPAATIAVQVWLSQSIQLGAGIGTATFDLTDLILLPDSQTAFVGQAGAMRRNWTLNFDGINSESYINNASGVLQYRETSIQRGPIPKIPVGASARVVAMLMAQPTLPILASAVSAPANDLISASINVRERTRFSF